MQKLLFAALTAFGRSFGITFLAFAAGILGATNTSAAWALSIAALAASVVAGLKSITVYVKFLSWAKYISQPWAAYADAFTQQGIGALIIGLTGWLAAPDWALWHSALLGILTGAAVAAVRALQGAITPGEAPFVNSGVPEPPPA